MRRKHPRRRPPTGAEFQNRIIKNRIIDNNQRPGAPRGHGHSAAETACYETSKGETSKGEASNGAAGLAAGAEHDDSLRLSESEKCLLMLAIDQERRTRKLHAIWRLSRQLKAETEKAAVLSFIPRLAAQTLDAEGASLQLYDAKHQVLVFHAVANPLDSLLIGYALPTTTGIGAYALHTGRATITRDVKTSHRYNDNVEKKTGRRIESLLTVPMVQPQGMPIGVLQVLTGKDEFWRDDLEFLQTLMNLTSNAMFTDSCLDTQRLQSYRRTCLLALLRNHLYYARYARSRSRLIG